MKPLITSIVSLVILPTAFPQVAGALGFDLEPGQPVYNFGVIQDADTERTIELGEEFITLVRMNDAENLMGVEAIFPSTPILLKLSARVSARHVRTLIWTASNPSTN